MLKSIEASRLFTQEKLDNNNKDIGATNADIQKVERKWEDRFIKYYSSWQKKSKESPLK